MAWQIGQKSGNNASLCIAQQSVSNILGPVLILEEYFELDTYFSLIFLLFIFNFSIEVSNLSYL